MAKMSMLCVGRVHKFDLFLTSLMTIMMGFLSDGALAGGMPVKMGNGLLQKTLKNDGDLYLINKTGFPIEVKNNACYPDSGRCVVKGLGIFPAGATIRLFYAEEDGRTASGNFNFSLLKGVHYERLSLRYDFEKHRDKSFIKILGTSSYSLEPSLSGVHGLAVCDNHKYFPDGRYYKCRVSLVR